MCIRDRLKGVFNFSPATTVLEGTAWLLYVIPTMALFWYAAGTRSRATADAVPGRTAS